MIISVPQTNQTALWEEMLVLLCGEVCGFPRRLNSISGGTLVGLSEGQGGPQACEPGA